MSVKSSSPDVSIENIYKLDGRVPVAKAIPFGLQHVMAMFVSNLAPIAMVCGVAKLQSCLEATRRESAEWSLQDFYKVQCLLQVLEH